MECEAPHRKRFLELFYSLIFFVSKFDDIFFSDFFSIFLESSETHFDLIASKNSHNIIYGDIVVHFEGASFDSDEQNQNYESARMASPCLQTQSRSPSEHARFGWSCKELQGGSRLLTSLCILNELLEIRLVVNMQKTCCTSQLRLINFIISWYKTRRLNG